MALAEASGAAKVVACLDARMGEVYYAAYIKEATTWHSVIEPGLYKPDAVLAIEGNGWVGAGSGWQVYAEDLSRAYGSQLQAVQPALLPTAKCNP